MTEGEETVDRRLLESEERVAELKAYHAASGPYQHCVIDRLCAPAFLRAVHDELTTHMKANFKETDLFKVFQTPELGALDEEALRRDMPHLLQLRSVLYSERFRKIVQEITGCDELIDRVDCSSNAYAHSCHLLCHDDVIGTRRVSYIIYLSDPDEPWTAQDGGAVELYPLERESVVRYEDAGEQGVPEAMPTKSILPLFNSMLFFTVQPGRSYHAVQEVFAKTRPRLSISGWYHGATAPVGSDRSSLQQILRSGDDARDFRPLSPLETATEAEGEKKTEEEEEDEFGLSAQDRVFLREWISSEYLSRKSMKSIHEQFCDDSSVQLNNFLVQEKVEKLTKLHIRADRAQGFGKCAPQLDHAKGLSAQWKVLGPPHKRRYLTFDATAEAKEQDDADAAGAELEKIRETLLNAPAFARYLKAITTLTITGIRDEVRRFRPGFDYTVAHYGILTKEPRLDATLCFVNDDKEVEERALSATKKRKEVKKKPAKKGLGGKKKKTKGADGKAKSAGEEAEENDGEGEEEEEKEENADDEGYDSDYGAVWEDGEVGGFECFIEADQEAETAEAAEVYRSENAPKAEDEEPTLLSVSACNNSLSLVLRDEGIMKFIKYVSANAPGSRWDVTAEYAIVKEEDDGDDDEEEEEENEEGSDNDVAETNEE